MYLRYFAPRFNLILRRRFQCPPALTVQNCSTSVTQGAYVGTLSEMLPYYIYEQYEICTPIALVMRLLLDPLCVDVDIAPSGFTYHLEVTYISGRNPFI